MYDKIKRVQFSVHNSMLDSNKMNLYQNYLEYSGFWPKLVYRSRDENFKLFGSKLSEAQSKIKMTYSATSNTDPNRQLSLKNCRIQLASRYSCLLPTHTTV